MKAGHQKKCMMLYIKKYDQEELEKTWSTSR